MKVQASQLYVQVSLILDLQRLDPEVCLLPVESRNSSKKRSIAEKYLVFLSSPKRSWNIHAAGFQSFTCPWRSTFTSKNV